MIDECGDLYQVKYTYSLSLPAQESLSQNDVNEYISNVLIQKITDIFVGEKSFSAELLLRGAKNTVLPPMFVVFNSESITFVVMS